MRCSVIQYSTSQYITSQYSAVHHSTSQHSTFFEIALPYTTFFKDIRYKEKNLHSTHKLPHFQEKHQAEEVLRAVNRLAAVNSVEAEKRDLLCHQFEAQDRLHREDMIKNEKLRFEEELKKVSKAEELNRIEMVRIKNIETDETATATAAAAAAAAALTGKKNEVMHSV